MLALGCGNRYAGGAGCRATPRRTGPIESMQDAVDYLRARLRGAAPRAAVVLGSGLGRLARGVEGASSIPFARIPGFPPPGVPGHAGEIVAGRIDGVEVLLQRGRFHLYAGLPPAAAARPVRLYASLGIVTLGPTSAAGRLSPLWRPPALPLAARGTFGAMRRERAAASPGGPTDRLERFTLLVAASVVVLLVALMWQQLLVLRSLIVEVFILLLLIIIIVVAVVVVVVVVVVAAKARGAEILLGHVLLWRIVAGEGEAAAEAERRVR